jgi:diguanylate cyclase (GGDEF)-like protein
MELMVSQSLEPRSSPIGGLSAAIAAACRQARNEQELYEGCRSVLVKLYGTDALWLSVTVSGSTERVGPADRSFDEAAEVFRCVSGESLLTIHAEPEAIRDGQSLPHICFGLSVALEMRGLLLDRQAALDDATFQLGALRRVVRLLSSVHSTEETQVLIHDFMSEVFFAWWAVFYRMEGGEYVPLLSRCLGEAMTFEPFQGRGLDRALPPGSPAAPPQEVGVAEVVPPGTELVVPMDSGGERLALMLLGPRLNEKPYGPSEIELAGALAQAAAIALTNAELVGRLHSAATTDGLTGLLNRRAIEERLKAEISRSMRHQVRTSIALIDLDKFKLINDTLGHAAGDRFLVHIGHLLRKHVRSLDVSGRLGGDEFLVILPMTSTDEAKVFVNRVRDGLREFHKANPEFGLSTLSVGLAETPRDGDTVSSLLAAADAALYSAKGGGRDLIRDVTEG